MKIQVFSDLHLEFHDFKPPDTDADVIVLAGDIHVGIKGIEWAMENFHDKPVLYVFGNHEYYYHALPGLMEDALNKFKNTNISLLENNAVIIEGVRFLGCTLWTDFALYEDATYAGNVAERAMNDYRLIRYGDDKSPLKAAHTMQLHHTSRAWLAEKLTEDFDGETVIITHHAPSELSVADRFKEDTLSAAFASSLDNFISNHNIKLWVHGHTHNCADYRVGDTRVICNPRGYPREALCHFNHDLIIDI